MTIAHFQDTHISVDKLASIAKLANTTLDWLVFGKGEPPAILNNKNNEEKNTLSYTIQDIGKMIVALVFYFHADISLSRTKNGTRTVMIVFHELEVNQIFPLIFEVKAMWERAQKEQNEKCTWEIAKRLPWNKYMNPRTFYLQYDVLSTAIIDFIEQLSKVVEVEKIGDLIEPNAPFCDGFELLLNESWSELGFHGFGLGFQNGAMTKNANQLLANYLDRLPQVTMKEFLKEEYLNDEYK